jgi:hypothetical protein
MKTLVYLSFLACALCVACKDESLREDLERQEKKAAEERGEYIDDGSIRVVTDTATALAAPNCVMVRPGETIEIPVAKAFAVWEKYQDLFGKKFSPRGDLNVVLAWAYPHDLIAFDEIEIVNYEDVNKAAIRLTPKAGMTGNALVALTVAGEIRWSWHAWVTDYHPAPDLQYDALAPGPNDVPGGKVYRYRDSTDIRDHIFMDRNLGANSADPTRGNETHGMYYQWGKKDPLPGFAPPNYIRNGTFDIPSEYRANNLAYSIEYPDEFIVHAAQGGDGWYSYHLDTYDDDLWGGISDRKTIYDPCPEGWRVPLIVFEPSYPVSNSSEYIWHVPWAPLTQFTPAMGGAESPLLGFYPVMQSMGEKGELDRYYSSYIWTATMFPRAWKGHTGAYSIEFGDQYPSLLPSDKALALRCERYFKDE